VQGKSPTRDELSSAYIAWMKALVDVVGSAGEVHRRVTEAKYGTPNWAELRSVSSQTVRNWISRGSLPAEAKIAVTQRLVELVETVVSVAPPGSIPGLSFSATLYGLRDARTKAQSSNLLNDLTVKAYDNDWITYPAAPIEEFELRELQLGSWINQGEIPPYCWRTIDSHLQAAIENPGSALVVVSGPPKAGKTRTLLEILSKSTLKERYVYWANPYTESIDNLIELLPEAPKNMPIVILDDLQKFNFGPFGLTFPKFMELEKRAKVLATVHSETLTRWSLSKNDFGENPALLPSPRLAAHFAVNSVRLEPALDEDELKNAELTLGFHGQKMGELTYLAAELASVEALISRAEAMRIGNIYQESLVNCAVDGCLVFPGGFELQDLAELVKANIKYFHPSTLWHEGKYSEALADAMRPLTPGAPHAILMPTPDNPDVYALSDFLWDHFASDSWNWQYLDFEKFSVSAIAEECFSEYLYESTIGLLTSPVALLEPEEVQLLGLAYQLSGDLIEAEKCFREAMSSAVPEAVVSLSQLLLAHGKLDEAYAVMENHESPDLPYTLTRGFIAMKMGLTAEAEMLFRQLPENAAALSNLAVIMQSRGDFDGSIETLHNALRFEDEWGLVRANLALTYLGTGRLMEARTVLEDSEDVSGPMNVVKAILFFKEGDLPSAESHFMRALANAESATAVGLQHVVGYDPDGPFAVAAIRFKLGELFWHQNRIAEAQAELEKASSEGSLLALASLSLLKLTCETAENSDEELAKIAENATTSYLLRTYNRLPQFRQKFRALIRSNAKKGNPNCLQLDGWIEIDEQNWEQASSCFEEAIRLGSIASKFDLAHLNATQFTGRPIDIPKETPPDARSFARLGGIYCALGDFEKAEENCHKAIALDDRSALVDLSYVYLQQSKFSETVKLLQGYPESELHPMAINNLAVAQKGLENKEEALRLFTIAANAGVGIASRNLGDIAYLTGEFDEAEEYFRVAIEQNEPFSKILLIYSFALRGDKEKLSQIKDWPEFAERKHALQLVEICMKTVKARNLQKILDRIAPGENELLAEAADIMDRFELTATRAKFLRLMPENAWLPRLYLALDIWEDDWAESISILRNLRGAGFEKALTYLGEALFHTRSFEEALEVLEKARALDALDIDGTKYLRKTRAALKRLRAK
jgi:tetratricopeptide (TPR) repeat protein